MLDEIMFGQIVHFYQASFCNLHRAAFCKIPSLLILKYFQGYQLYLLLYQSYYQDFFYLWIPHKGLSRIRIYTCVHTIAKHFPFHISNFRIVKSCVNNFFTVRRNPNGIVTPKDILWNENDKGDYISLKKFHILLLNSRTCFLQSLQYICHMGEGCKQKPVSFVP